MGKRVCSITQIDARSKDHIYRWSVWNGLRTATKELLPFVLPDEVGGTHPALVEAMGFGNCVLVNDTPSNLEVISDAGFSYRGSEGAKDLREQLQTLLDDPRIVAEFRLRAERRARATYNWSHVVRDHVRLYKHVLNGANGSGLHGTGRNSHGADLHELSTTQMERESIPVREPAARAATALNKASK